MDLNYSEEQNMLRESVARFVRDRYDFGQRQQRLSAGEGAAFWPRFAELGWLAIPFSEDHGGIGGGTVEVGIVMEGLGRALALEPYLAHMVATQLLARMAKESVNARHLPAALAGESRLALAFSEAGGRYHPAFCATTASPKGDGYVIQGSKNVVLGGQHADLYLVVARSAGQTRDEQGLTFFLLERDHPALRVREYQTNDGTGAADLTFDQLEVNGEARIGELHGAFAELEWALDLGVAYQGWEAVGAMSALSDATLEYLNTRKQFGKPLGANQALTHRMVDLFIAVEESRSSVLRAALAMDGESPDQRRRNLSLSKIAVDRCARFVGQTAVQLHGAMGVTNELPVGHYFKRLTAITATFGDSEWHARRIHRLDGASSREAGVEHGY
ncbi:acyl-CoA dehydrogenase [Alloalcanivorax xenomutans]|uniref:acyl-CoA dehydrogenase family protein n=1 Tax=Alloalcanivorax xenomutans TaxID=1094342 RepID=UPI003A805558